MTQIYLFDWGNTLMVDDPEQPGKMKDWPQVAAVEGAERVLSVLSARTSVYIASGARDSDAQDILAALSRVGLAHYISECFCPATVGVAKGEPDFLPAVLGRLGVTPDQVVMVGDSYEKDIRPACDVGMRAVWFNTAGDAGVPRSVCRIRQLVELI